MVDWSVRGSRGLYTHRRGLVALDKHLDSNPLNPSVKPGAVISTLQLSLRRVTAVLMLQLERDETETRQTHGQGRLTSGTETLDVSINATHELLRDCR
jgi:hypothetical protein